MREPDDLDFYRAALGVTAIAVAFIVLATKMGWVSWVW